MVEPEVAYMDLEGDMALMEEFVSHVVGAALRSTSRSSRACSSATCGSER